MKQSKDYLLLDFNEDGGVPKNQVTLTHRRHHKVLSYAEKVSMQSVESLDFSEIDNIILRKYTKERPKYQKILKTFGKWIICSLIGIFVGLICYCLKASVDQLQEFKFNSLEKYYVKSKVIPFVIYTSFNLAYGMIACIFVIIFGPLVSSSGLPEVKGYLNGIRIQKAFNLKTLVGKISSLIFSFSSGLVLGPEGPMFHIGSIVGSSVSQFKSKTLGIHIRQMWIFQNDSDKRDFISCGAAAGIAAAFGAPIGGVLFALEEGSSFWSNQLTWRTFFSCLVATMIANLFLQGFQVQIHDYGVLTFGVSKSYLYTYLELVPFAIMGIMGGLIGALFVHLNIRINYLRKKYLGGNKTYKFIEVVIAVLLTSILCYFPALFVSCTPISNIKLPNYDVCDIAESITTVQFFCPDGYYNQLATLSFTTLESSLKILYSRSVNIFSPWVLFTFSVLYLLLCIITSGLYVASGIFIPMMIIGAAWGRLVGLLISSWFTTVDASIYALIGSAAMMGGSLRMTISLVVIIVELTEGTQYLLPVILVVMLSKWTGDAFNESVYEHLIELKHIPYLPSQPAHHIRKLTVADAMASNVKTLPEVVSVRTVVDILINTPHNGFPVVMIPELHDYNNSTTTTAPQSRNQSNKFSSSNNNNNLEKSLSINDVSPNSPFLTDSSNSLPSQGNIKISSSNINSNNTTSKRKTMMNELFDKHVDEEKILCGLILRSQLSVLLMKKIFINQNEESSVDFLSENNYGELPINHQTFTAELASKIPSIEEIAKNLTDVDYEKMIDLRPYMNFAVVSIKNYSSLTEAYRLFRMTGLRHIIVVNVFNQIVGILTRKDLL